MPPSGLNSARSFLSSFLQYAGIRAWVSLSLMVLLGLTEGVGLVLLVPLLHLIGFGGAVTSNGISSVVRGLFESTGLPLTLPTILCTYVTILSVHALAGRYLEVLNSRLALDFTRSMQDRLYAALARVEWVFFTRMNRADVIRVVTGDLVRAGFAARRLLEFIATVILTIIYIGFAASVSWVMTLFTLACFAAIFLILHPYNRRAFRLGEAFQKTFGNIYVTASEHLDGMKLAKSYNLHDEHAKSFSAVTSRFADQAARFAEVDAGTRMYHQIGAVAAVSAFLYISAELLKIPSTSLLLVVFVFARLSPRVSGIQHYVQHIANSLPAYREAALMLSRFEAAAESPGPPFVQPPRLKEAVRFNGVSYSYNGSREQEAVHKIDLVVPARKTVAIVGPSGSGKTTLADLLMGLLTPDRGEILIDELPLTGTRLSGWRSSVGYVPQETFLFHTTIRDNLLWARPGSTERELWDALGLAAAEGFVSSLPEELDTVVGDRGIRLSGGERQRIALARALLRKPPLLLLDEATSSLDTEHERHIQDALEGLHGQLTMVIIAHRLSTIRRADDIVVLDRGRVKETGAWECLLHQENGRFQELFRQQRM